MSYFNSITQNVVADANNSINAPLTAGSTYTGTGTSTLGVAGIQVSLKADQNCTVWIDQSPDNNNWDISDSFNYHTISNFGVTVQAINSYVRVRVKNITSANMTYMRLQTALCPIVEAVPRALSSEGNLTVSVKEIEGDFLTEALVSPMRALKVAEATRLVGAAFIGNTIDSNFWTTSGSATGTVTQTGGQATLATGTTGNSTAKITSVRSGRYVSGYSIYYRSVIRCPAKTGANTCRWGAYDTNDGYFFQHDGTTLSVGYRKGGSDTTVSSGSFSGDWGSTYVLDTNANTFEIYWTNRSAWWFINDELLHKVSGTTAPLVSTPTLPITAECNNTGGNNVNNTLEMRVASINRLGQLHTDNIAKHLTGATTTTLKYGAGKLHRIVNNKGVTTSGLVTVYDNTTGSGTTLAIVDTSIAGTPPFYLEYMANFYTGLTITTAGSGTEITVIYE